MKSPPSSFEFRFSLTIQEFWDFQKLLTKSLNASPMGPRLKNLLFWVFLCFFMGILVVWVKEQIFGTGLLLGVASGLVTFLLLAKYAQLSIKNKHTPMPHGIILSERKLIVTPIGVTHEWEEAKGSISWSAIEDIHEYSTAILLKVDSFLGIPIPNRIFSTETEKREFLSSIREFWKQHHSQQKT